MNFDLNIDNYTKDELIEMFELPSNFDQNIIEIKEAKLKDNIINNREINKETQIKTLNFILKAKNIILNGSQNQKNNFEEKIEQAFFNSKKLKSSKLEDGQEHMIQERGQKPYFVSQPSEFFPGIINPLKKRIIKKTLNVDSKFRENYYTSSASNFNFNLPIIMNDILEMNLSAIELPTTFYAVSKQYGNNFFTITVNTLTTIINIPDGNYNQNTIMDSINYQLSLAGSPFNNIVFTINVTSGQTGTGQTLVGFADLSGNSLLELNFQADRFGIPDRNTPLPLKLGWVLGFRNGIYTNNLNYVSEGLVDTTGSKYLFLVVDDYNNNVSNNFYAAFNSSILNKNILARISLQGNIFSILQQNGLNLITTSREYFGPVNIQTLNIQLLDEYGRVIDLNNMDFSFCLSMMSVYDI
jgi:hypothetical protein